MTEFDYTVVYENGDDFSSEAVDVLYFNENTKQLAVEWTDSWKTYLYDNVSPAEVDDLLVGSVGGNVTRNIKQAKGPGTEVEIGEEVFVNKPQANTREFSLQPPVAPPVVVNNFTTEYSLQTPAAAPAGGVSLADGTATFTLFFTVNGGTEEKSFVLPSATSFDNAVESLESFAGAAGISIKIHKVVADIV